MKSHALVFALAIAAAGCGRDTDPRPPATTTTPVPATPAPAPVPQDSLVRVTTPAPGDTVRSPLIVSGEARGKWFFEASFPVRLLDADGRAIAETFATAKGDWMTTEFVPFTSTVTFPLPAAGTSGTLVLVKDNPSDLRELDDERRIPIVFGAP